MKKNTETLINEAYAQIMEDRKLIRDSYDKFADTINNVGEYAAAGQNLNKCLELMTKQSAQLLEIAKLSNSLEKKSKEQDTTLSSDESDSIYQGIAN